MTKILFAITLILFVFAISACTSAPIKGCTMEAKICPDGSAVGRTGPNCEFAVCPAVNNSMKILTDEDIRIEMKNLTKLNAYPDNKNIDSSKYPIILGTYSKNGLTLVEKYYCSDLCPDAGSVSILFENITSEEQCAAISGKIIIDPAWKAFIGCSPNISGQ